ncbi:hypothetical protein BDZ97DRAFT_1822921 [Flammula alnicola]|nr:hypothetical protein BDZ97DRAFT_1822921 [Flammula alnicola]
MFFTRPCLLLLPYEVFRGQYIAHQSGKMENLKETVTSHLETLTLHPIGNQDHSKPVNDLASAARSPSSWPPGSFHVPSTTSPMLCLHSSSSRQDGGFGEAIGPSCACILKINLSCPWLKLVHTL